MAQQQYAPPPVFGFARDDSINLEDIFTDWFVEDANRLTGYEKASEPVSQPPRPSSQPATAHQHSGNYAKSASSSPIPAACGQPSPFGAQQAAQSHYAMPPQQHQAVSMQQHPQPVLGHYGQQQTSFPCSQAPAYPNNTPNNAAAGPSPPNRASKDPYGAQTQHVVPQSIVTGQSGNSMGLDEDEEDDEEYEDEGAGRSRKRAKAGTGGRRMTEEQKVERRERNREHAKRSRVRKKFLLESLQKSVNALQEENDKLRQAIRSHLKDDADQLLKGCEVQPETSLITSDPQAATRVLDDPDYTLVKALQTAQQNFVITDPTLPDNPIIYASGGFLSLTGYKMDQILGRNCRFLQGPDTDPAAVDKIRRAIEEGVDGSVCLLNYNADGTTFWNQFFIAALRGADSSIVNYVGVQCKVSEEYAREVLKKEAQQGVGSPLGATDAAGGGGPTTRSGAKRDS